MKKIYFLLLTLLISSMSFGQTSDLFFSKYGEGSSNNKFIEIYNGTGAAVDLGDYSISNCSNGCNTANEFDFPDTITWAANTMLADGDVYVIAHGSADATILASADMTFNFLSNGDDAFAITLAGATASSYTIIDLMGDLTDVDGSGWDVAGTSNGTTNHTLTRKSSVCDPNPTELGSFGTNADNSEWIVGASDSGWDTLGSFVGCSTTPSITITSPSDGAELTAGTTSIDVVFTTENAPATSQVDISIVTNGGAPVTTNNVTSPFTITPTANGDTFSVTVDLVDGGLLATSSSSFSVAYPCDLQIGTITSTCDSETNGLDTYTTIIEFTGGGTSAYTIDTEGNGTLDFTGGNPSMDVSGFFAINGVDEGLNFTVTFIGDVADSSCDFTRSISSPVCVGTLTCPNIGDVIITEIMKDPNAVADGSGEYFEVYNTTGSPIDMQGWEISDFGTDSHTIAGSLIVPAMGYAVLSNNSNFATNGGVNVDYQYSGFTLSNGSDEVQIVCSSTVIDAVAYTDAEFPDVSGTAMELSTTAFNSTDNDLGSNWGEATSIYGAGDNGTPGGANDFTLSINQFDENSFNVYPNPTSTGYVNITSTNADAMSVAVFDVLGKQVINETISNNRLDVSSLNAGLYIVKISQNNATSTKKLVIK